MTEPEEYRFREFTIRPDMMAAIKRYINRGIPPGHFLKAVLANDLFEACARADDDNIKQLPAYVAYFYNEAPSNCYGSPRVVALWIKQGGLNGITDTTP